MVIRYASDPAPPHASVRRERVSAPVFGEPARSAPILTAAGNMLSRLRRRLFPMLLIGAIPFAAALAWKNVQPPVYEAVASVFIDPNNGRPGRTDQTLDPVVLDAHLRTVTSRALLQKAIERDKLAEDSSLYLKPTGVAALAETVIGLIRGQKAPPAEDRAQAILRLMSEKVSAERSGEANLIAVRAIVHDAGTAARLANAVAQTFVDEVVSGADRAVGSDRARLMARADELRAKLREAETKLAQARVQFGLDPARADQDLAGQLARARAAALEARTKSDQIQKLLAAGKDIEAIADLVRSPSIERLRIQYNEAAAQEANFRTSLGPRHPAYLEAAEQAREKRRLLMEGLRLAASAAKADMQAARDLELQLEKRLGADTNAAAQAPPSQLRELEREAELARLAYDRQMRLVDGAEGGLAAAAARLVAKASVPAAPVSLAQTRLWGLASAVSGVLALLVLLTGGKKATPKAAPKKARGWRLGASNPAQADPAPTVRRPAGAKVSPAESGTEQPLPEAESAAPAPVDPTEEIATEVTAREEEFALQVTLVTATAATPERNATALRLAAAAARREVRVLLIDANEEDRTLTQRFGANPALATVQFQRRRRLVVAAEIAPGITVSVVPHESDRASPANDTSLRHLSTLVGNYDLVIVDGPTMASSLAVRKLARAAQGVVVVATGAECDVAKLAVRLDVMPEVVRVIRAAEGPAPETTAAARPMSIVRLQQCA